MKTIALLILSTALALALGCKKSETDKPTTSGTTTSTAIAAGSANAESTARSDTSTISSDAPSIADNEDHITVLGKHRPAKPSDPVQVRFEKFRVVKASFDPKKVEGGTATIEIDLSSLKSGSGERDDDLKSPTYIDVAKFATVTIEISNVKRVDKTFSADATVKLRGVTKTYPVTFEVVDQKDNSVRIKGEHTFSRLDFSVGTDPSKDSQQQVDTELTIQMLVTLEKP